MENRDNNYDSDLRHHQKLNSEATPLNKISEENEDTANIINMASQKNNNTRNILNISIKEITSDDDKENKKSTSSLNNKDKKENLVDESIFYEGDKINFALFDKIHNQLILENKEINNKNNQNNLINNNSSFHNNSSTNNLNSIHNQSQISNSKDYRSLRKKRTVKINESSILKVKREYTDKLMNLSRIDEDKQENELEAKAKPSVLFEYPPKNPEINNLKIFKKHYNNRKQYIDCFTNTILLKNTKQKSNKSSNLLHSKTLTIENKYSKHSSLIKMKPKKLGLNINKNIIDENFIKFPDFYDIDEINLLEKKIENHNEMNVSNTNTPNMTSDYFNFDIKHINKSSQENVTLSPDKFNNAKVNSNNNNASSMDYIYNTNFLSINKLNSIYSTTSLNSYSNTNNLNNINNDEIPFQIKDRIEKLDKFFSRNFKEKQTSELKILDKYDFLTTSEYLYTLINFCKKNKIKLYTQYDFKINNFLYKHRDYVYSGELILTDTKCSIKRFSLLSKRELDVLIYELDLLFEIKKSELFFISGIYLPFISFFDDEENNNNYSAMNNSSNFINDDNLSVKNIEEYDKNTDQLNNDNNNYKNKFYVNISSHDELSKLDKYSPIIPIKNNSNQDVFYDYQKEINNTNNINNNITENDSYNKINKKKSGLEESLNKSNNSKNMTFNNQSKNSSNKYNSNNLKDNNFYFNYLNNDKIIEKQKLCAYLIFEHDFIPFEQFLKKNTKVDNSFRVLKNILKFILLLHSRGIVFLDLKPDLLYLDKKLNLKVFDFYNSMKIIDIDKKIKNIYTPMFCSPEIFLCYPHFGIAQDIFSLGCLQILLFINYKKHDETSLRIYLKRVFNNTAYINNENNNYEISKQEKDDLMIEKAKSINENRNFLDTKIPKIPKNIDERLANIIKSCFIEDPLLRIDILQIINKINFDFLSKIKETDNIIEVSEATKASLEKYIEKSMLLYISNRESNIKNTINKIDYEYCGIHGKNKIVYCESCKNFYCTTCIAKNHSIHIYQNCEMYYDVIELLFYNKIKELDNKFLKPEFFEILALENDFQSDYELEREKIKEIYSEINNSITNLRGKQLELLEKSKNYFLSSKFHKLFSYSDKIKSYYEEFYKVKNLYSSYFKRFDISLKSKKTKVNFLNYESLINRFELFYLYSEVLKTYVDKLIEKSSNLKIQGKYKYNNELYTKIMIRSISDIEKKIVKEKYKAFDFAGKDILFLPKEIITIVANSNCIFSYIKNSFKLLTVNFDVNSIKIKKFLKGSASIYFFDYIYVTGGEYNDEGTRNCYYFSITEKILAEIPELNTLRRYHTLIALNDRLLCAIGGWSSYDVEIFDAAMNDYWRVCPKMNYARADATIFFFNKKWIYVFGGWDFITKEFIGGIERYEFFDNENSIKFHGSWENVTIKSDYVDCFYKYNMGVLLSKETPSEESIILVGGFTNQGDYSNELVHLSYNKKKQELGFNFKENLDENFQSTYWYEKKFLIFDTEEGSKIACNFTSNNDILVYYYIEKEFKIYPNLVQLKRNQ